MTNRNDHPRQANSILLGAAVSAFVLAALAPAASASVTASTHAAAIASPVAGAIQVAGFGKRGGSGAFKPDPIYGGGRGRDPYGAPLDADPYRAGGNPNNIKFAPPNAGLHGPMNARPKKDDREKAEAEAAPRRDRRMNPEDRSAEGRANRAAQQAGEEAE